MRLYIGNGVFVKTVLQGLRLDTTLWSLVSDIDAENEDEARGILVRVCGERLPEEMNGATAKYFLNDMTDRLQRVRQDGDTGG